MRFRLRVHAAAEVACMPQLSIQLLRARRGGRSLLYFNHRGAYKYLGNLDSLSTKL